jgi:hypothetical protein
MTDAPQPADQNQGPYGGPPGPEPLVFDTFLGINTQPSRPGIDDKEMYWCDGFFPLGKNNLRTLPGVGPKLYTAPTIELTPSNPTQISIVSFGFGNLGSTPVCIVFLSNGQVDQVNTNTGEVTHIFTLDSGPLIENASASTIGMSQWGNQYIVICWSSTGTFSGSGTANGSAIWDGTNVFYTGTVGPDITISNTGAGYYQADTTTITTSGGYPPGTSTGTSLTVGSITDGGIVSIAVVNPGSGYSSGAETVLVFNGGNESGTRTAQVVLSVDAATGGLSGSTIIDGGAGYTSSVTATLIGGSGADGEASLSVSNGSISNVSITNAGTGYKTTDYPALYIRDASNPVAQGVISIFSGAGGTALTGYMSRMWTVDGNRVQYTAPGTISDYSSADGAGAFQSTDSFLRRTFIQPVQSNGFLYLIADSSVNCISGVTTSVDSTTGAVTTAFSNQNADPEVGSPWPATVQVFSRNIIFANPFGVHVCYGGSVTKISDALDGVYTSVANFGGVTPSAAKAIIYGKKVYILLMCIQDPVTKQQGNKLLLWNEQNKAWFSSDQNVGVHGLNFIASQEIDSQLTAWGTNGTEIYPLFQTPSEDFTKTVQSKLWSRFGYWRLCTESRLWGMAEFHSSSSPVLDISLDSEQGSESETIEINYGITWENASRKTVTWYNSSNVAVSWLAAGMVLFSPTAVNQWGALCGFTLKTTSADVSLISLSVDNEQQNFRG